MSVGFGGEAKIWRFIDGIWKQVGGMPAVKKAGELWAVALDTEGKFLVGTTYDGRVNVWELQGQLDEKSGGEQVKANSFATWETRGGYGLAVDVVSSASENRDCQTCSFSCPRLTCTSHQITPLRPHHTLLVPSMSFAHRRHVSSTHYLPSPSQ